MRAKTEELQYKNQQAKLKREKDLLWNATHSVGERRMIK